MKYRWNAVAAVASIISAIGVAISVVYLATQVRQSTQLARIDAQRDVIADLRDVTLPLVESPELARVFAIGIEDFGALAPQEQITFLHIAFQFGKAWESAYFYYQNGLVDEETWTAWTHVLASYVSGRGWRTYWSLRGDVYAPEFQRFVESLPVPAQRITPGTILQSDP